MKYRYKGSGFVIDVREGEQPQQTIARLEREQPNVDKPVRSLLASQVRLVHAIEVLAEGEDNTFLVQALREFARMTHGLEPQP